MDSNINSTFPKTQKKIIYVELNIYQIFSHIFLYNSFIFISLKRGSRVTYFSRAGSNEVAENR